jgi:hypothetical protein
MRDHIEAWGNVNHLNRQGSKGGKGGLSSDPSTMRAPPQAPVHLQSVDSPEVSNPPNGATLLPRESGEDIGMGSPVPLSSEAVDVITKLRNMKVSIRRLSPLSFVCHGKLNISGWM